MTIRQSKFTPSRKRAGFSMIDVLVAIVVLATALLALAALQGALTRNSADARARSQIAAYTEGLLDQMRSTASYSGIVSATITPSNGGTATAEEKAAYNAEAASGVSGLTTTITATDYYGVTKGTGGNFTTTVPADLTSYTPRYKQVNVTTNWTDATGESRTLKVDTIISPVSITPDNSLDAKLLSITGSATPVVREYNPGATAGVIPIAVGTGQQSAATNPKPELLALTGNKSAVVGTSFNVLTFQNPDSDNNSIIQQRIDTQVIACSCKYGGPVTADDNTDFATIITQPYRPTYWDGAVYVSPAPVAGQTSSATGIDASATQSPFCDICCRDHNDTGASGEIRFDPWNTTGDFSHYRRDNTNALVAVLNTDTTNAYLNACRLIRVEGRYAVATDLNDFFFGLLATETPVTTATAAKSPNPDTSDAADFGTGGAVAAYKSFVLNYLTTNISSLQSNTVPSVATTAANYAATPYNLDRPATIEITYNSSNTDYRYLHARGIYVDYLEQPAVTAISNAITTCTSSPVSNCYLPILPFTTINLSEIASWSLTTSSANCADNVGAPPVVSNAVSVNNQAIINEAFNASRGVVTAQSCAHTGETPIVQAAIGNSNSGLAATGTGFANPIDPDDASSANSQHDTQNFSIVSSNSSGTGSVSATITLTPASPNNVLPQLTQGYQSTYPSISWQLDSVAAPTGSLTACSANASGNGNKTILNDYSCPSIVTAAVPPTDASMTVILKSYNYAYTATGANPCPGGVNTTVQHCKNFAVDTASVLVNGVAVTPTVTVTNDGNVVGATAEQSTLAFPSLTLSATDSISIGFTLTGDTTTSYTCSGKKATYQACP